MGQLRRRTLAWRIFLFFVAILILWEYWELKIRDNWDIESGPSSRSSPEKLILLWTTMFYETGLKAWALSPSALSECPFKCQFTEDKAQFKVSDAVVYHGWPEGHNFLYMYKYMYPLPRPLVRRPGQVWVHFMLEPPLPGQVSELLETLEDKYDFNWTMGYRRDSDIVLPYGRFAPVPANRNPLSEILTLDKIRGKTALVAGLISACGRPSGRDMYIRELRKYVRVDLYGSCGDLSCPHSNNCYKALSAKYKFWLSFENSLCADYVSEKFYLPLKYGVVPIFYGHPDAPLAPQGSYINTKDFEGPKGLADYLMYLDRNPEEYGKYFKWKREFRVLVDADWADLSWPAWCDLCSRLHRLDEVPGKTYPRIADWVLRNNSQSPVCFRQKFNF